MQGEISRKEKITAFLLGIVVGVVLLSVALYQIPAVQDRLSWRIDFALTFVRAVFDPVKPMPTPIAVAESASQEGSGEQSGQGKAAGIPVEPSRTSTATLNATATSPASATQTLAATATITPTVGPTLTPTPLPGHVELAAPKYEKQEVNDCGPATLTMHLRYYGWEGTQATISELVKPKREDRNVNVEELAAYVNTKVPGLEFQYRVGGDIDTLRRLLAAGFPVTIEEAFIMAESYWFNDDRFSGHYLLLTGYDDATQRFIAQDVFVGPNMSVAYKTLDKNWQAFNRVYILIYPPDQREQVQAVLGDQWDPNVNRQHALDAAQKETQTDPTNSYTWFNLGTNLVYFEKYGLAAQAYDQARKVGLPQRMLRYQFGPFFAYFHTDRIDDLMSLTEYALKITPTSEEAILWRGWGMYRQGKKEDAMKLFAQALEARPGYPDAQYALNFVRDN